MQTNRRKLNSTAVYTISDTRNSEPAYPGTRSTNEFLSMTLGERAFIARYIVKEFSPTDAVEPKAVFKKKYSRDWWEQKIQYVNGKALRTNGDTAHFVLNACLFPERSQDGWVDPPSSKVDFYACVTTTNALDWYDSCPEHLRVRIDEALSAYPEPIDSRPGDVIYDAVKRQWGDRPLIRYVDEPGYGKEPVNHYVELELFNQWCVEYEREAIRASTCGLAPLIQEERRMLNKAMGLNINADELPSQAEGLDTVQAATIHWLQSSGEMPLEFLARTYRSDDVKMADRLTAARTLMDYVHRKVPVKQEVETKDTSVPKLDPKVLKNLTEKELGVLEKLLAKLSDDK